MPQKNIGLIIAIIFASLVISGSLVFFGIQVGTKNGTVGDVTTDKIEQAFDNYVKKQQAGRPETAQSDAGEEKVGEVTPVSASDHIFGNKDAEISLIEYSDFECPFCKRFHSTAKQIVDAYGGKVNWVYRHYPLDFHDPLATKEAIATECANELGGNDKFWAMADLIFETTKSNGRGMEIEQLPELAEKIGLDKEVFSQCLDSGKYDKHIQQDIAEGEAAGVTGTPGNILLNNKTQDVKMISGAQPITVFKQAIDLMLKN